MALNEREEVLPQMLKRPRSLMQSQGDRESGQGCQPKIEEINT